jgi:probable HAF family extracellular repeat protein
MSTAHLQRLVARPVVLSFLILLANTHAASFRGLSHLEPDSSYSYGLGISPDGSIAVGYSAGAGSQSLRWLPNGSIQLLGQLPGGSNSYAFDASSNASVIVGWGESSTGNHAFRWTAAGGMQSMAAMIGNAPSIATAISYDGLVVAGQTGADAFRWSQAGGLQTIPSARADAITGDGTTLVGTNNAGQAFLWKSNTVQLLGFLPGGFTSFAFNISDDGKVVVGKGSSTRSPFGDDAFRWTAQTGMVSLGDLPGGQYNSSAWAISGDGGTIVGSSESFSGPAAFIWDSTRGMRDLRQVLINDFHVNPGAWTLQSAISISADGTTILGYGVDPSGRIAPWIVTIPEPSAGLLPMAGLFFFLSRKRRQRLL